MMSEAARRRPGFVYILTNPEMPGVVKIGHGVILKAERTHASLREIAMFVRSDRAPVTGLKLPSAALLAVAATALTSCTTGAVENTTGAAGVFAPTTPALFASNSNNCSSGVTIKIQIDNKISSRTSDGPSHTVPGACRIIITRADGTTHSVVSVQGAAAGSTGADYANLVKGYQPVFDGRIQSNIFSLGLKEQSWVKFSAKGTELASKQDGSTYLAEVYSFNEFKTRQEVDDAKSVPTHSAILYFVRDDQNSLVFTAAGAGDRKPAYTDPSSVLIDMDFNPHVVNR